MDGSREAGYLGAKLDAAWTRRVAEAEEWNARLARGEIKPSLLKRAKWLVLSVGKGGSSHREQLEKRWRSHDGRKEASVTWALNDVFGFTFWTGGAFKVCS